jgi:hypothetical protein
LDQHTYRISFEDTLKLKKGSGLGYDTLVTKSYTLEDVTDRNNPDTLVLRSRDFFTDDEQPIIDGGS